MMGDRLPVEPEQILNAVWPCRPRSAFPHFAALATGLLLASGVARAEDCELAQTRYQSALAVAETAPAEALSLLREATGLCPAAPHGWFVMGNVESEVGNHAAALAAYRQAAEVAEEPQVAAMAQAYAGLATLRSGDVCAAQREFRQLVPRPGEPVADWLREPWETFARAMAEADLSASQIGCALAETPADRSLGVCPRVDLRIEFGFDSAAIEPASYGRVNALAEALRQLGGDVPGFRLVGHTDRRGGEGYNQALSERRAASVRAALLERHGSLAGRIETSGRGESEPLVGGDSETDHAVNRRVEVRVLCGAAN